MSDSFKPTVLVAPNAFKGSLTAPQISDYFNSLLSDRYRVISLPAGDGGDGTAEIIASYFPQSHPVHFPAVDALERPVRGTYYRSGKTAIIELAGICGLKTLKVREYDVLNANTTGIGKAVNHAVANGANEILLCVGGSASIDGGLGALSEMGLKIAKSHDKYRNHIIDLKYIDPSDLKVKFKDIKFTVLCDVENPLYGKTGAAYVFAPQKGASQQQVIQLDTYLKRYAALLAGYSNAAVAGLKYGGAAGGITTAFAVLLGARLISGSEYYLQVSEFEKHLRQSHVVITGEGRIDRQSLYGKIPGVIADKCRQRHTPVIAVAGISESGTEIFDRIFQLIDYAPSLQASVQQAPCYFPALCREVKQYLDTLFR